MASIEATEKQQRFAATAKKPRRVAPDGLTIESWNAYSAAYRQRYGVEPVRNAAVSGQLGQLVKRLGSEEAPLVAAAYVAHNRMIYVAAKHPVSLLLRDAEGLRTEWATGRSVTDTEARHSDRRQSNFNAFAPLIAEAEQREREEQGRANAQAE